ncbi:hypothetical protein IFR05_012176 [Cadophora sp. M221]|nr:hypothetical protein IFR05_012176 [Cadophora sp. M221]
MALADEALCHPTCPTPYRRTDLVVFVKFYAVCPELVWKLQTAIKLLYVLDWRGGMQDYSAAGTENAKFQPLFARLIASLNDAKFTTEEAIKLLETPTSIKVIAELKVLYDTALQKHNAYLMKRYV